MTTKRTNTDILKGLVATGMKMHYGDKPEKQVKLRILWELKHIIDADFVDYYVMVFWIFRHMALSMEIGVWGRGAMPSSIVCYCLGLTEVDPVKYGLHSVRFVNNELPKFQFDVEASRFGEFMKGAEELLAANAKEYNIRAIRQCLFKDVKPYEYLSKKHNRPLPENIDDELVRYALYFPQTMDLYDVYFQNPKSNILIYQEQMLDILKETFHVPSIKANQIRLSIQRGETEQIEAYKKEIFSELKDITPRKAEIAWKRLISNPRAFLKAHAVSRVMASYHYEF